MLNDWSIGHTKRFQQETITFGHNLDATGLFTDEALIELLRIHPHDQLDVCSNTQNPDPGFPNRFLTGDFREVPAETLLEAAKAGRIFINLRKAMNIHPEYHEVLQDMFGSLQDATGFRYSKPKGGILISSSISKTPYHFDKTETILWHIKGDKRIYIYPMTPEFIQDKDYEEAVINPHVDELPYETDFDQKGVYFDLEPGRAIAWPLNSPHKVDNSSFCVSVTTEYSTRECVIKNNSMVTNAILRNAFGLQPSYERDGLLKRAFKAGMGVSLRKAKIVSKTQDPDMVHFKIDPNVKGYIVPTEPFIRNF